MNFKLGCVFVLFFELIFAQENRSWFVSEPILEKGSLESFDEIAVKDPTVVFYKNAWHMFYTARGNGEYTTGYVSAKSLEGLQSAPRVQLSQIRGKTPYGCAPQVFYFEPQEKWYLIYQNRDENYEAVFSTNKDIANSRGWTSYEKLLPKDSPNKWIDFWVIADGNMVYLFYTEGHKGVMVRSTSLENFPSGWGESTMIFDNVHEAVHIYKVKNKNQFHMIYELNTKGIRSFGLAASHHLKGPWRKVTDRYATGDQLKNDENVENWTEMVSHGEAIRTGYDQHMEYDAENTRWIIQGMLKNEMQEDYPSLPWKLGVIELKK